MKKIVRSLAVAGLLVLPLQAVAADGYRYMPLNLIKQEHSNWCWAASAVTILNWFGKTPRQCDVANWALGTNYACNTAPFNWNNYVNQPNGIYGGGGSIQGILKAWGVNSYGNAYALSWSSVVTEVNKQKPFVMRYGWTNGGGHFIVGYGYNDQSGTRKIAYMNPWPGEGYTWVSHSWALRASDHTWTHTLRTN